MIPARLADRFPDEVIVPRFAQEFINRAAVDCVGNRGQVGLTGHQDADSFWVKFFDSAQKLIAVHPRHPQVGEYHLNAVVCQEFKPFRCAAGGKDMGKVIAALKAEYPGRIDFGKASAKVKAALG